MMTFLIGVAVGFAVGFAAAAWYCTALMDQWNHAFIVCGATISRIHARWIIEDTLGTFEGHPMEELMAFLNRYNTRRTTRTTARSKSVGASLRSAAAKQRRPARATTRAAGRSGPGPTRTPE